MEASQHTDYFGGGGGGDTILRLNTQWNYLLKLIYFAVLMVETVKHRICCWNFKKEQKKKENVHRQQPEYEKPSVTWRLPQSPRLVYLYRTLHLPISIWVIQPNQPHHLVCLFLCFTWHYSISGLSSPTFHPSVVLCFVFFLRVSLSLSFAVANVVCLFGLRGFTVVARTGKYVNGDISLLPLSVLGTHLIGEQQEDSTQIVKQKETEEGERDG